MATEKEIEAYAILNEVLRVATTDVPDYAKEPILARARRYLSENVEDSDSVPEYQPCSC